MSEWEETLAQRILDREIRIRDTWEKLSQEAKGAVEKINAKLGEKSNLKLTAGYPNANETNLGSNRGRSARMTLDWNSKVVNLNFNWQGNQSYVFRVGEPEGHLKFAGGVNYPGVPLDKAITTADFVNRVVTDVVEL